MARPTKPKDLKPKAESEAPAGGASPAPSGKGGAPALDLKFIVLLLAIIVSTIGGSVGSMYVLGPMVLVPAIVSQIPGGAEFRWTPEASDTGEWFFKFRATDGSYSDTITARVEIAEVIRDTPAVQGEART